MDALLLKVLQSINFLSFYRLYDFLYDNELEDSDFFHIDGVSFYGNPVFCFKYAYS